MTIAAAAPNVVVVNPNEPAKTLQQLIAEIKEQSGQLQFRLVRHRHDAASLRRAVPPLVQFGHGARAVHRRGAFARSDGRRPHAALHFRACPPPSRWSKGGALRALAVTSAERVEALPDVPDDGRGRRARRGGRDAAVRDVPGWHAAGHRTAVLSNDRKDRAEPDIVARFDSLGFHPMPPTRLNRKRGSSRRSQSGLKSSTTRRSSSDSRACVERARLRAPVLKEVAYGLNTSLPPRMRRHPPSRTCAPGSPRWRRPAR